MQQQGQSLHKWDRASRLNPRGGIYVAPTSARAKRLFKSLLKPQLAHGSAPLFKPGLILALSVGPCGG